MKLKAFRKTHLARALGLGLALLSSHAITHEQPSSAAEQLTADAEVPLYDDLGDLSYPISTDNALAQRYFDQGLRLTYAFNHGEALRAFRAAQRQDPNCAMCYWGEAFVLGPNINAPMEADAASPALAALHKAKALAHHDKEHAWIEALAQRYAADPDSDQGELHQAYAGAMLALTQRYPDDQEIAVFAVDALMNTSPWDYWEADGATTKGQIGNAMDLAERVLQANPNHPGAIHLYIHLTEASAQPERAEPYADRLAALMPGAGHLVHMPSHTYFRIGRYQDSEETNKKAVAADEAYLAKVKASGIYPEGYYPHNIHFVLTSAQLSGDTATTFEYVKRLQGKIADEVAGQIGWIQAILTAPYFAHAQLSDPDTIMALPDPGAKFPFVQAMWRYARGVACAAKGEIEQARQEAALIADLNQSADFSMLLDWAVPAPDLLILARQVVEGRIAQQQQDWPRAIKAFQTAVTIQDSIAYMEPPYWYYPVRQSLGGTLLQTGRNDEAIVAFRQALEDFPESGWALYGLQQAYHAVGDQQAALETEKRLQHAWDGDASLLTVQRL